MLRVPAEPAPFALNTFLGELPLARAASQVGAAFGGLGGLRQ